MKAPGSAERMRGKEKEGRDPTPFKYNAKGTVLYGERRSVPGCSQNRSSLMCGNDKDNLC